MSNHLFIDLRGKPLNSYTLSLTHMGMNSVNWDYNDSGFKFVFGEDKVCRVHTILAEFLSPKIARLRRCDISFDVYRFEDPEIFKLFQRLVSSLLSGKAFRVKASKWNVLIELAKTLGNDDLLTFLLGTVNLEYVDLTEKIYLLRIGTVNGARLSAEVLKIRDAVASNFYKIRKEILDEFDLDTAQIVLSSPLLRIKDEDSLYNFVRSHSETNLSFASLFRYVCFDYLSIDRIEDFVSFLNENSLETIIPSIWRSICCRLIRTVRPKANPRARPKFKCAYSESKQLDGIIAHLTRECGGNVHDKGIVYVTGTGDNNRAAVELDNDSKYSSSCENSWICYDFKERCITPKSYSVRSSCYGCLKSWLIEVSDDGYSWTEIDRRASTELTQGYRTRNFNISKPPKEGVRFFRVRQIGNDWGALSFSITALEIFGEFYVKEKMKQRRQEFLYQTNRWGLFPPPLLRPSLDGIIAHLTRECGGNVHDKGIVDIGASSWYNDCEPKNVADFMTKSCFCSGPRENSYIYYDFKKRRVIPKSYSLKCAGQREGCNPKSWVIEVSNDMTKNVWEEIDRRDIKELIGKYTSMTFEVSHVPRESVRFLRLRQTGKNYDGNDQLKLASFEIFGDLIEK